MVALNLFRGKEEGGVFINQRWTLNLMCMVKIRSNPRVWRLNPPCLMVNHVVKFRSQLLTFFHWQTWAKHEVWQPDLSWNFCLCWIGVLPIWKCSLVFFRCHFGVKQETQTKGFLFPSFTSALKRWKGPDPSLLNCGDLGSFKTKSNSFQNEFLLICEAFTWLKTCALKCKDVEQRSVWFLLSLPN